MKILYCDEHIIVCIKPSGAVSTDEPGGMPELIRNAIGEERLVRTVHRLDSIVSGLMVYALSKEAASDLSAQMENGSFEKEYMAVVEGRPEKNKGKLRDYLYRNKRERKTYVTDRRNRNAQEAILTYQVLKGGKISLVRIKLITGRTHQIRCQFSSRDLPLYGDGKYGSAHKDAKIALWSVQLSFLHPVTKEPMTFSALPPDRVPWNSFNGYCESYESQDLEVEFVRSESFSDCPYAEICGFCAYQGMEYEKQLEKKQRKGGRWIKEFGKVEPILKAEQPLGYRNKLTLDFGIDKNGRLFSGIYSKKAHRVLRIGKCRIDHPKLTEVARTLIKLLAYHEIGVYDAELPAVNDNPAMKDAHSSSVPEKNSGWIRQATLRISTTGEVMVVLSAVKEPFPAVMELAEELRHTHSEIGAVILEIEKKGSAGGKKQLVLQGNSWLEECWMGQPFQITANSFMPLHPSQSQKVYETALTYAALTGNERVLDISCGAGVLALAAAPDTKRIFAVDASKEAVQEASKRAQKMKMENLRLMHAQPEEYLDALARSHETFDTAFLEASRCRNIAGCINALGKLKPEKIVYIGRNSESMGKDLKTLVNYGYQVQKMQMVDVLPFTEHVETVILLKKADTNLQ